MTRRMPPAAQIAFTRSWLERQGIEAQTIDVEAYIDPSLSYEENIKLFKRQFKLGGGRSRKRATRDLSVAECDVAIGNYKAGFNHEVTVDACACGHPDACVDLERAGREAKSKKSVKKAPLSKYHEAEKLHRSSWGLLPKNSLDRLLKAKFILEHELGETDSELYRENERLIANYKRKLGLGTPAPSVPAILTPAPAAASDMASVPVRLGGGGIPPIPGVGAAAAPKPKRRQPAAKPATKAATKKPKPPAKAKKTAAKPAKAKNGKPAPELTAAQRKRLAAKGSITIKRGGMFVTVTR